MAFSACIRGLTKASYKHEGAVDVQQVSNATKTGLKLKLNNNVEIQRSFTYKDEKHLKIGAAQNKQQQIMKIT